MKQTDPITIVVADEHPVILQGLIRVLEPYSDLLVVDTCKTRNGARNSIRWLNPDVAVLDIEMSEHLFQEVAAAGSTRIILFTADASSERVLKAVESGARGIVSKTSEIQELVACIREVAAGRAWLPTNVTDQPREEAENAIDLCPFSRSLTVREQQVLMLASQGLSNKRIGQRLNLSDGTVKNHLHNIYRKTGVSNRTELASVSMHGRRQTAQSD